MNKKILVKSFTKTREQINFFNGKVPDTYEIVMHETVNKIFDDFDQIIVFFSELGMPENKGEYFVFEEGRVSSFKLENANELTPSEYENRMFKEGQINLYNAEYEIYLQIITEEDSSRDAISQNLGISKFN